MMATADDESVISYEESLANFGAAYATTQESVKSQVLMIATLQGQMQSMQQYCMNLQQLKQHLPPQSYTPQQRGRRGTTRGGTYQPAAPATAQPPTNARPPTPMKQFENWNYCHMHGGDVDNGHTSMSCNKPGPAHNQHATRQDTMGGSTGGLHKTILPSVSGRVPPPPRQVHAPVGPPIMQQMSPMLHMAWQQAGGPPLTHSAVPSMYPHAQGMWHVSQHAPHLPPATPPSAAVLPPLPEMYTMPPYYQYQQPF
jgi:hypothetical protein